MALKSIANDRHDAMDRRAATALSAARQLEAICDGMIECVRQQCEEAPAWAPSCFDPEQLPDIVRALAIRGRNLADVALSALNDPAVPIEDLERVVSHGY